ncbi:helix-turn-helix domain-containing protein [Streptomyces sp. SID12501]|uniref:Helix-turn-helix domain-containing protein n=1 Tax=Streptomyces sp. SID12501 TaxID=2706042 RepID=A0A6B3BIE4_9ACTN|nr:helix-turn-helix domain-containing protein [Streptomyces sp. SID12501]NEC85114.1 helix-turn-helix domain-containing protein [Streptomyces sp. SID12501]
MDTQNPSAPPCAESRPAGKNHPHRRPNSGISGVIHDNARHTTRFTVIGNHLAQHPALSLLAIGLSVHIQSLQAGSPVDIKTLAKRFPEGPDRIAAALRELETHGYLRRTRERTTGGNIVTRTVSCNRPGHHAERPANTAAHTAGDTDSRADSWAGTGADTRTDARVGVDRPTRPAHPTTPGPPKKRAPRKPLPAVPQPAYKGPGLLQAATDLLAGLRRLDPDLLLSACDTAHLAPGVAAWLERDASPTAVRHALTSDLPPEGMRRPAAFLAHRLTAKLPPPAPFGGPSSPPETIRVQHPLRNCDGCDRGFRGPEPGRCRDCRMAVPVAA